MTFLPFGTTAKLYHNREEQTTCWHRASKNLPTGKQTGREVFVRSVLFERSVSAFRRNYLEHSIFRTKMLAFIHNYPILIIIAHYATYVK